MTARTINTALRAWVVTVVPLAGPRATVPFLAQAAKVGPQQMDKAVRRLVDEGVLVSRMQTPQEAPYGVRRARVYALVASP
jgi:hypothetical protein